MEDFPLDWVGVEGEQKLDLTSGYLMQVTGAAGPGGHRRGEESERWSLVC